MKRSHLRVAAALLGTILLLQARSAAESKAEQLARKAGEIAVVAEAQWKRFVLEPETFDEATVKELVDQCDKAVDLYQSSLEEEESGAVNNAILVLARRSAKLRFDLMRREQARKRPTEAAPPPREPSPTPTPTPTPTPSAPAPAPPESATGENEAETTPALPEITEDARATRMGIQALRNFLMHDYFASRKWTSLVTRCPLCEGTGRRPTGRITKDRKIETTACTSCGETGFHLNEPSARKGYWLCQSPLYRADEGRIAAWKQTLSSWQTDPRRVTEFLDRLSIEKVDYHGLWATVRLAEKGHVREPGEEGKQETLKKFDRKRECRLVRIGRRWFFYDEKVDADLFRGE